MPNVNKRECKKSPDRKKEAGTIWTVLFIADKQKGEKSRKRDFSPFLSFLLRTNTEMQNVKCKMQSAKLLKESLLPIVFLQGRR